MPKSDPAILIDVRARATATGDAALTHWTGLCAHANFDDVAFTRNPTMETGSGIVRSAGVEAIEVPRELTGGLHTT